MQTVAGEQVEDTIKRVALEETQRRFDLERDPPIRARKSIPDNWLKITLREGRNRQVRRMTAAVGLPTLRLVRWSIGDWSVEGIAPGRFEEVVGRG